MNPKSKIILYFDIYFQKKYLFSKFLDYASISSTPLNKLTARKTKCEHKEAWAIRVKGHTTLTVTPRLLHLWYYLGRWQICVSTYMKPHIQNSEPVKRAARCPVIDLKFLLHLYFLSDTDEFVLLANCTFSWIFRDLWAAFSLFPTTCGAPRYFYSRKMSTQIKFHMNHM